MQNFDFIFIFFKIKKIIITALECFMLRIKDARTNDVFQTAGRDLFLYGSEIGRVSLLADGNSFHEEVLN